MTHDQWTPPIELPGRLPDKYAEYKLIRLLGRGGQGAVYLALFAPQPDDGVVVVLKFLFPNETETANQLPGEIRDAWSRRSENMVHATAFLNLSEYEVDGWLPWAIVMPFYAPSLRKVLDECRRLAAYLEARFVQAWLSQLIKGLKDLHEQDGLAHRDLKPENILFALPRDSLYSGINSLERAKALLADFGVAGKLGFRPRIPVAQDMGYGYKAPEVAADPNIKVTPAEDVWSLGRVLLELIAVTVEPPKILTEIAEECTDPDPAKRPSLDNLRTTLNRRNLIKFVGLSLVPGRLLNPKKVPEQGAVSATESLEELARIVTDWDGSVVTGCPFGTNPVAYFQERIRRCPAGNSRNYAILLQARAAAKAGGDILAAYSEDGYLTQLRSLSAKTNGTFISANACWLHAKIESSLVCTDPGNSAKHLDQAYKSFSAIENSVSSASDLRPGLLTGQASEMWIEPEAASRDRLTKVIPSPFRYMATTANGLAYWHLEQGNVEMAKHYIERAKKHCDQSKSLPRRSISEFMDINREIARMTADLLDLVLRGDTTRINSQDCTRVAKQVDNLIERINRALIPATKRYEWLCICYASLAAVESGEATHLEELFHWLRGLVKFRNGRVEFVWVDPNYALALKRMPDAMARFESIVGRRGVI